MRQAVRDIPGFEVVEESAISTFSFAKYLMWKDLVDRTDELRGNRFVKHLIDCPETPFVQACDGACLPLPNEMDRRLAPKELFTPLPADSSQLAAVVAAMEGYDFVIIGPPGTGKSQTITNIIAQCLAIGKTVLFVAEKSAALDVVYRRLKKYDLGDVCLELHSNKTDRKRVLRQLGAAWARSGQRSGDKWEAATQQLGDTRDKLNTYVEQLHAPGSHGFSIYDAIGFVAGKRAPFDLRFDNLAAHDPKSFERLADVAKRLGRTHDVIRGCTYFDSIATPDWSFAWQEELIRRAEALRETLPKFNDTAQTLARELGLKQTDGITKELLFNLGQFTVIVQKCSEKDFSKVVDAELDRLEEAAKSLSEAISIVRKARSALSANYANEDVNRIPLDDLDRQWREACARMWPFSFFGCRRVTKLLQSYASQGRVDVATEIAPLRDLQAHLDAIRRNELSPLPVFREEETDSTQVSTYLNEAKKLQLTLGEVRKCVEDADQFGNVVGGVVRNRHEQSGTIRKSEDFTDALRQFKTAYGAYVSQSGGKISLDSLKELEEELDNLIAHKERLADWAPWVSTREEARTPGLAPLVDALEHDEIEDAEASFRIAYFTWWLPLALDASPALRGFRHWSHEDLIKEFRSLDEQVLRMAPEQVRAKVAHGLPQDGVPRRSELGTLRHQIGLQRPSIPIRKLIESMPSTFSKLAPCMLMSPLSVAQYLPAHHTQYDVVIFDEASQITTWDAVGAIARAKQSIIVGDPKQLPPTNFFGRTDDEDEDNLAEYEKDLPSILEEASTAGLPEIQLNWHYRSRDESLIAFSNHHYYDNKLITFPSPETTYNALVFHKNDGIYARGSGRTNIVEARAIVDFAIERMQQWLQLDEEYRPTLGVITFNIQQQELILNLFDEARRSDPRLEWFFDDEREEPIIAKNLENIQGDERDIICFSVTFGRDLAGKISMSFGALNRDGGEKRLNVAITRARSEMHVFSSILAEDIDTSRTQALGVTHLKNFLDYAQRGPVALPALDEGSVGDVESPFEEAVLQALRTRGWDIRPQVGVSGYRIDLGVIHPDHAGKYLAGIECDGATYHSSATARDRDKIREAVLCNLGWSILRIWSTDWFMNPKDASERIHAALTELLKESRRQEQAAQDSDSTATPPPEDTNQDIKTSQLEEVEDTVNTAPPLLRPVRQAQTEQQPTFLGGGAPSTELPRTDTSRIRSAPTITQPTVSDSIRWPCTPNADRFFDPDYAITIKQMVNYLVEREGPVEADRLARIISKAHGWKRTGAKIRQRIDSCLGENERRKEGKRSFIWAPGSFAETVPFRHGLDRSIPEISRHEMFGLIAANPGLNRTEDPVRELAMIMGILRLSGTVSDYISHCLSLYDKLKGSNTSATG